MENKPIARCRYYEEYSIDDDQPSCTEHSNHDEKVLEQVTALSADTNNDNTSEVQLRVTV